MRILTCLSFSLINLYVSHESAHRYFSQLILSRAARVSLLRGDTGTFKAGPRKFNTVHQAGDSRIIPVLNNPINPDLTRDHLRGLQFPIAQSFDDAGEVLLEVAEHCAVAYLSAPI
jgi:hypothetical protein